MTLIVDKSNDPTGGETLEAFANAERFNRWMFEAIAPYCNGKVLEIGSGIGNLSIHLLTKVESLSVSDMNSNYCCVLKKRLSHYKKAEGVYQIDLSDPDFERKYSSLLFQFDTVVALNVIEHIKDDRIAIENCKKLLRDDGRIVILVPAFQSLYNSLDAELKHFRRYSKKKLKGLLSSQGFSIIGMKYFNSFGIIGWWLYGSVFKRKKISRSQLSVYNLLVPLFRFLDKLTNRLLGLSLIAVAPKNKKII